MYFYFQGKKIKWKKDRKKINHFAEANFYELAVFAKAPSFKVKSKISV